ncbi:hypothetical protein SAMN05216275_10659 [Streptosporangium canum]|uniref:Uncharacterized protein n=1 Tax=Streptosporangium canum TaxID=324952 RepID=A0A1I3N067_9ACTN|nr:hypothetical protein SAMN05216275_10659 [Streptosporangium canum]
MAPADDPAAPGGQAGLHSKRPLLLAGLFCRLSRDRFRHLTLLVRPETILRWHRDLLRRRHAVTCTPRRRGHPRTISSICLLVLRLARENPSWGYRRIHSELAAPGTVVAASTVWEVKVHGIDPSPERQHTARAGFLRSQADALLACDFFEVRTLTGARLYVSAIIQHATRRVRSSRSPRIPRGSGLSGSAGTSSRTCRRRAAPSDSSSAAATRSSSRPSKCWPMPGSGSSRLVSG